MALDGQLDTSAAAAGGPTLEVHAPYPSGIGGLLAFDSLKRSFEGEGDLCTWKPSMQHGVANSSIQALRGNQRPGQYLRPSPQRQHGSTKIGGGGGGSDRGCLFFSSSRSESIRRLSLPLQPTINQMMEEGK